MKKQLIKYLRCLDCKNELHLFTEKVEGEEVISGKLECSKCSKIYPVINGIPRFVSEDHYVASFGIQWNRWALTQHDSYNKTDIFKDRFLRYTGWDLKDLSNKKILNIGCGPGVFVDVVSPFGGKIFAMDISSAVESCYHTHKRKPNVHIIQADLYNPPFPENLFDFVYCIGVIQLTPNPKQAIYSIANQVKSGEKLCLWIYKKRLQPKYIRNSSAPPPDLPHRRLCHDKF